MILCQVYLSIYLQNCISLIVREHSAAIKNNNEYLLLTCTNKYACEMLPMSTHHYANHLLINSLVTSKQHFDCVNVYTLSISIFEKYRDNKT